jgi:hypothetical protein
MPVLVSCGYEGIYQAAHLRFALPAFRAISGVAAYSKPDVRVLGFPDLTTLAARQGVSGGAGAPGDLMTGGNRSELLIWFTVRRGCPVCVFKIGCSSSGGWYSELDGECALFSR